MKKQTKTLGGMKRLQRQFPFLRSVLKEANRLKRQESLQHANADQVNAVSELVLNLLKNNIPVTLPIMAQLRPIKRCYATWVVVNIRSKNVVRGWSSTKDEGCFKGFTTCYVNVLD